MHKPASKRETPVSESERRESAPTIVIGFVGGFVGHDNAVHSPVQLAERLRKEYPEGVYIEVFENHRREDAHRKILKLLGEKGGRTQARHYNEEKGNRGPDRVGTNSARQEPEEQEAKENDGAISESEKQQARIIIYGMSWGGSETVVLARELEAEKIPVLLTVQVDSVTKFRENDQVIPANVAEAVNFYQSDGLLHGRAEIRAADAKKTQVLGNFRYSYKTKSVNCEKYPWYDRWFTKYHTEIECDPEVWHRVEGLIRAKLPTRKETDPAVH